MYGNREGTFGLQTLDFQTSSEFRLETSSDFRPWYQSSNFSFFVVVYQHG